MQEKQKLVEQFDKNGDHMLDAAERKTALEFLRKERAAGRGRRGPGGRGPSAGEGRIRSRRSPARRFRPLM